MKTAIDHFEHAILKSTEGQAVILQKMDVRAELLELMLTVKLSQHYKNTSTKNIETIYTFPLAWGATLLGLSATLAGKTWEGTVLPKYQAESNYAEAIKAGDTPIMVEKSGLGLYTARLGNLKPGEEALIEIEYSQVLKIEQGKLRLAIPTTVAPRYGDPSLAADLRGQASVDASLDVVYPLDIQFEIRGTARSGAVSCPSHPASVQSLDDHTAVRLLQNGMLDRDVVLVVDGLEAQTFNSAAATDGEYTVMTSVTPTLNPGAEVSAAAIDLKILVDCSGSMEGESMALARAGLQALLPLLGANDTVSFSRFGSAPHRVISVLMPASDEFKQGVLHHAIDNTRANLGGTEMHAALWDTFDIAGNKSERPVNVLLITDGEVWGVESIISQAKESHHRIFAVGVGNAPAESLLREIAEHSDGACELVSPHEDMAAAIQRMVLRMRQGVMAGLSVDWHAPVIWAAPIPKVIYPGETLHLAAILASPPAAQPSFSLGALPSALLKLTPDADTGDVFTATDTPQLSRMVGAKRLMHSSCSEEAAELALKYQLVTEHTHLYMVVQRADEDKVQGLPIQHVVEHMVAAGSERLVFSQAKRMTVVGRSAASRQMKLASFMQGDIEAPAFMRRQVSYSMQGTEPMALLALLEEIAVAHTRLQDGMARLMYSDVPKEIDQLIQSTRAQLQDRELAWAAFFEWLITTLQVEDRTSNQVKKLLIDTLKDVEPKVMEEVYSLLSDTLPDVSRTAWS